MREVRGGPEGATNRRIGKPAPRPQPPQMRLHVGCRVRPLVGPEKSEASIGVEAGGDAGTVRVLRKRFALQHVFPGDATSDHVFNRMVRPVVDRALSTPDMSAAVVLFGQTGAGKTHTLLGVGPLLCAELLSAVGDPGRITFTALEVLGDEVCDLLGDRRHVNVFEREAGVATLAGATVATIESLEDLLWLFEHATRQRATAATGMNDTSSRSHAILSFHVQPPLEEGDGNHDEHSCPSAMPRRIELVDLAGSERNKKTQNVGQRFQESVGINSDLLALGNVLRAVNDHGAAAGAKTGSGGAHVPFRSCKLTRLLRPCFSGRCETAFISCVAPTARDADESLRTLQYAALAAEIRIETLPPPPPPPPPPSARQLEAEKRAKASKSRSRSQPVKPAASRVPLDDVDESAADQHHREDALSHQEGHHRPRQRPGRQQNLSVTSSQHEASTAECLIDCLRAANAENENLRAMIRNRDHTIAKLQKKSDRLEKELGSVRTDLQKDDIVFAEKLRTIQRLQRRCAQLEAALHTADRDVPPVKGSSDTSLVEAPDRRAVRYVDSTDGVLPTPRGDQVTGGVGPHLQPGVSGGTGGWRVSLPVAQEDPAVLAVPASPVATRRFAPQRPTAYGDLSAISGSSPSAAHVPSSADGSPTTQEPTPPHMADMHATPIAATVGPSPSSTMATSTRPHAADDGLAGCSSSPAGRLHQTCIGIASQYEAADSVLFNTPARNFGLAIP